MKVAYFTSLQSQEILNRPVFVLEILKSVWKFEHCWKFWTDSENSEQILKITENSEHCWTDSEYSENSEHYWKFWTDSENSEQYLST